MDVLNELLKMQDSGYKAFHSKLMPTVSNEKIIGVRVPNLRKFAKDFYKTGEYKEFLDALPHTYYEEDNVHAFLIEQIKDFEMALQYTESFLPYIDNWATCDMFMPKVFKDNSQKLLPYINSWLESEKTYTVRYGIKLLMDLFLDEKFERCYMDAVANIHSDEYYVKMMVAWYFATALFKQYDMALYYIEDKKLDDWTHNKAIQKAIESNRIPKDIKTYLKTLKI